MFKLNVTVENPMLQESYALRFQFDPETFDEKTLAGSYTAIRAAVDQLLGSAANPTRPDLVPIDLASLSVG